MPIDAEYPEVIRRYGRVVKENQDLRSVAVEGYLRRFIAFESSSRPILEEAFAGLLVRLKLVLSENEEPMLNILAAYEERWKVLVFPRARHRPSFFFAEGDGKMLISPAAVDLGGVCITPLEKDFHRVTRELVVKMFEEVTLGKAEFDEVVLPL